MTALPFPGAETVPADLLAAFIDYEQAIVTNDVGALNAWFAPGPATMRGDSAGLLVGHDAIAGFRNRRGGVGARTLVRVEHRDLADGVAMLVAVSRFDGGGFGLQSQVWTRTADTSRGGGWRIAAAHVTPRPSAFDRRVWRVVGDPLVAGVRPADGAAAPLEGLTVAVKDLFAVAGQRIGAGIPAWLAEAPVETAHASAVADLLRGGADVAGIAATDELAYSLAGDNAHYGTPPNGAAPGRLPGGSSSGPASAVALGQADLGLGTDTAGSVRLPASYQGLWGLRTTHDLVSRERLLPLAPSFDTVGWLTRDGETLERVVAWCVGDDDAADLPARLAVPVEALAAVEPATRVAFEALLARFEALGVVVDRVGIGPLDEHVATFRAIQCSEAWRSHGAWVTDHPGALGDAIAERFTVASRVTPEAEAAARATRDELRARIEAVTADAVLVLPTAPGPAPLLAADPITAEATRTATMRLTTPVVLAGIPGLSVPLLDVSVDPAGRGAPVGAATAPVGVTFAGPAGSDLAVVRLARRLVSALASQEDLA